MPGNRKAAEAELLAGLEAILPGSENGALYKARFAQMNDKEFEEYIKGLEGGTERIGIIAPNMTEPKLDTTRNLDLAEKWGHKFFEKIWMMGDDGTYYLSPIPYLVIDLPLRRQAQHLIKKISIPEDNRSVDDLTGQPTGKSKGSKISYPEVQVLAALDLPQSLTEMIKYRGGDAGGFRAMNKSISSTGAVSQEAIEHLATGVESTRTLHTLLLGMHLSSTGL
jgi:hypothetical protein